MTQKKSWLLSALGALAIAGCQVDDVGPEVRCAECPDVLEPGAAVELHLEWHEEPCDHPSRRVAQDLAAHARTKTGTYARG